LTSTPTWRVNSGDSRTLKAEISIFIFVWIFRTFWPKMAVFGGKIEEGVARCWPTRSYFGGLLLLCHLWENRSIHCDHESADRHADTRSDKPVGFYSPIAPSGPNAPSSECPPNVVPNCEFRTCQIPNFRTRSIPNLWTRPMWSFWTYLFAPRLCHTLPAANGSSAVLRLVLAASTRCLRRAHSIGRGCRVHTCVMAIGADFKMYLLRHFYSNRVELFYNRQETQTEKMMDKNFDIRILWF